MKRGTSIRSAIASLANEKKGSMTDLEIYTSRMMKTYLNDMAAAICGNDCPRTTVDVIEDPYGQITAYTDGTSITLNCLSPLCRMFSRPEDRFIAFMGMFFHEHGHVLYNDFGADKTAMRHIRSGTMYGKEPDPRSEQEKADLQELLTAMSSPELAPIFESVYSTLDNIVIDFHDEEKIMKDFGGLAVESIWKTREALRATSLTLEEAEEMLSSGKGSKLGIMYGLLLEFTRFGEIFCANEELEKRSEFIPVLNSIAKYAELAKHTDNPKVRYSNLNCIVLAFWPFLRDELKSSQNGGQSGDQGKSVGNSGKSEENRTQPGNPVQPSAERIQSVMDQLREAAEKAPQTVAPSGKTSEKAKANSRRGASTPSHAPVSGSVTAASSMSAAFDRIISAAAQEQAVEELEKEAESVQRRDAAVHLGETSAHSGVPLNYHYAEAPSSYDEDRYHAIMQEIGLYSKRLQKQMREILHDMQLGGLNRHKAFGRIVCPQDAYRPDELMFANKKRPQDLPDMAISVLVDHSGSMRGPRIETSCQAAVLLYEFATGLGIPVSVCGHRINESDEVDFIVYTDFDRYADSDRYRIAKMFALGRNRDGAAIEVAASQLEQRPEKMKLMFIISDGMPNHWKYSGEAAEADIASIVQKYNRKGLEIIAAAIGEDKESISRIYGDGFLDISDLSLLPKTLTRLVQNRLLSQYY